MADIKFTDEEVMQALECCASDKEYACDGCPCQGKGAMAGNIICITDISKAALKLIKNQKEKIDAYACINHLLEQDIADRDEMLKQKVEVVYADFMKDYECLKEELDGVYKELTEERAETERLQKTLVSVAGVATRVPQTICDHCYPDFDKEGKPVNVWKAKEGYAAIDALVKQIAKEAMS